MLYQTVLNIVALFIIVIKKPNWKNVLVGFKSFQSHLRSTIWRQSNYCNIILIDYRSWILHTLFFLLRSMKFDLRRSSSIRHITNDIGCIFLCFLDCDVASFLYLTGDEIKQISVRLVVNQSVIQNLIRKPSKYTIGVIAYVSHWDMINIIKFIYKYKTLPFNLKHKWTTPNNLNII